MLAEHLSGRDRVGDSRGRSQIVLEHLERAVAVAHQVQARNRDPGADLIAHAHQLALVVVRAVEAAGGDDAGCHDPSLAVHVPHEQFQRLHALDATPVESSLHSVCVDHARDRVDPKVLLRPRPI